MGVCWSRIRYESWESVDRRTHADLNTKPQVKGCSLALLLTLASVSSAVAAGSGSAGVRVEIEAEKNFSLAFALTFHSFSRIDRCFGGSAGSEVSVDTGPASTFRYFFFSLLYDCEGFPIHGVDVLIWFSSTLSNCTLDLALFVIRCMLCLEDAPVRGGYGSSIV